jgi:hypothetical protein
VDVRQDIQARLRERVREAIEATLDEELTAALGSVRHERTVVRRAYRHGAIIRTVTTAEGTRALEVPRGRVRTATGTKEFPSERLRWRRCWRRSASRKLARNSSSGLPAPLLVVTVDQKSGLDLLTFYDFPCVRSFIDQVNGRTRIMFTSFNPADTSDARWHSEISCVSTVTSRGNTSPSRNIWRLWSTPRNLRHEKRTRTTETED